MYKILSLDGGGIRGIFTATFLAKLEERLNGKKIGECFDLFAGTSTGGILACLLLIPGEDGRPKFSARDAVNFYINNGTKIFDMSWGKWFESGDGLFDEKYSSEGLKQLISKYAGDIELKDLLHDTVITSYDTENREIHLFKSHKARNDLTRNCPIGEVALATSAAPTYFEAVQTTDNNCLIDGGLYANNPSMCAYVEAKQLAVDKPKMMLSIGTGREHKSYHYKDVKDYGMIQWVQPIIKILFGANADVTEYFVEKLMSADKDHYYRVNVQLQSGEGDLDDTSPHNMRRLQQLAFEEFERLDNLGIIRHLIADLV